MLKKIYIFCIVIGIILNFIPGARLFGVILIALGVILGLFSLPKAGTSFAQSTPSLLNVWSRYYVPYVGILVLLLVLYFFLGSSLPFLRLVVVLYAVVGGLGYRYLALRTSVGQAKDRINDYRSSGTSSDAKVYYALIAISFIAVIISSFVVPLVSVLINNPH